MSMADLIDGQAELDDEENDDSFDEETGEERPTKRKQNGDLDDDSSEEEDDDDEEAARAIREGFIIDDEDEDEEPDQRERRRKRERHKKRKEREEEEAALDEEDLDLIGEANPEWERKTTAQPKLKRLKRGHREENDHHRERNLEEIFSDDEELDAPHEYDRSFARPDHQHRVDEFADFIEEDELEDEDERQRHQEEMEVARPRDRGYVGSGEATGLDKDALDDMEAIFGNGEDYDWALALEDEEEAREAGEHNLELKDVFEPSQLSEKLLTDEDNLIRWADEPERFQLDRMPYKNLQLSEDQFKEEARWITSLIWPKKQLHSDLQVPFTRAIGKVLEFFVVDEVEVPYVFQHRKDYLIHAKKTRSSHHSNGDEPEFVVTAEKLLNQDDLWRILELDLKFRALIEKRNVLEKTYDNLKLASSVRDKMVEAMLPVAVTMEELQDIQDYIYFQYSSELKDLAATNGEMKEKRRAGGRSTIFDRIRRGKAYQLVRAYGITPDQVAQNALREGRKQYTEDASSTPIDFADSLTAENEFSTGEQVLLAARQMFAEELFMNPRMRKHFRMHYYMLGVVDCRRTEKGLKKIDEQHPYYELKYLKDQTFNDIAKKPEMFLKMLKAEEEGLLEVKVSLQNEQEFRKQLLQEFQSDNFSELADAWNDERKNVLDLAFTKLERVITKGVKESMRTECQDSILKLCREEYSRKLDQAPYKPKGMILGTIPRVLALSNGNGDPNRDAVCWAWVEEDGRVLENGKFINLSRDNNAREEFVELVQRRKPDVIGVSGFSVETHKLVSSIRDLISERSLRGAEFEDPESGEDRSEPLEVVVVNDEVARLYKDSQRAAVDHPTFPPLARYCVALAKYLQNPMKEYAALGKDVISLPFHPCQQLLPEDKLRKQLDSAMVDMVNLCGVDINEAVGDSYTAALLPYVCGLGPRKATQVLKVINQNGGVVHTRDELVGDPNPESHKLPAVTARVWNNCASFLSIEYDSSNAMSDYLDNTRVHPEDYELGRKMAADALELDEEDVKAEIDEGGAGAVVRKLIKEDEQEKVNDLILEEYAEQLERNYNQRKRATLETIRAELQQPYEELRRNFAVLSDDEIFTMLTGETRDSLCNGMIVSVNLRVVKDDFAIAKLDCGMEGRVENDDDYGGPFSRRFAVGQTARAKVMEMDYQNFTARLSLSESALREPYRKRVDRDPKTWDFVQEQQDKEELREKDKATGRTQRVVKHPLFRPFNSTQAEEYLGSQSVGDAVIRPSSKGNDHLAVTWKVADGVFQHIDVLELQKENEFSVGRVLRVGGKYNYSDLDELIVAHVKAMAKKVDEMTQHEKYQKTSKAETENWLTTYTEANPKRSVYAFCLDPRHPGYFYLCFKAGKLARPNAWPVRVIPNAFELMKSPYPDMKALCNGFKLRHSAEMIATEAFWWVIECEGCTEVLAFRRNGWSYLVRWVKVEEGHTISWSIQPHKKSINFGIFKHPRANNAASTAGTPQLQAFDDAASTVQQLEPGFERSRRQSATRNDLSTAQEQLKAKGFISIQWHGKCDADKVTMGTYPVPPGFGGMYGLVFDNTFSKQVSKTATFVLLTYPSNAPPRSTHHMQSVVGGGSKSQSPQLAATASESVDSLQSHLGGANSSIGGRNESELGLPTYHVGVLQKRRRKRGQGYARRFFSLDFASCTLSYYYSRNSSALRGAIPLSLAAIAADERQKEISIDSGAEVWHLRAGNAKDFKDWTRALERASNAARNVDVDSRTPSPERHLTVKTSGLQNAAPNLEEDREWGQVEALVSRIVGTRDAVRRLSKDTAPGARKSPHLGLGLSSGGMTPHTEENGDYFSSATEKRPFWKRKSSTPTTPQMFVRGLSSQLAVPSPSTVTTTVTANGANTRKPRASQEESSMHDHCESLLRDLDAVLQDFSTLLANSKRRRTPAPKSATRASFESTSTGEFFDAEAGEDQSQVLMINRRSEEDTQPSEIEDEFVTDASSISSDEADTTHLKGAAGLFPTKPKSLDPLPIPILVKRRKVVPQSTVLPPSLIGFLRKNVGKDLSTISMPVSANEPISMLQRVAEQLEYSQILDTAASHKSPTHRLLHVTAFAISQFSMNRARERAIRKPFNPMLGETFELVRTEKEVPGGFRLLVEKVSHRPVRMACQADSANWSFSQSPAPNQKFWGKSAELITEGRVRIVLRLSDGKDELYSWNVATLFLRNVVMGEKYIEPVGTMVVTNETTGSRASVEFKTKGMFGGRSEDVQVDSYGPDGSPTGVGLTGNWTTNLKMHDNGKGAVEIWRVGELVENAAQRYGLTTFAAGLNEITELERGKLPPTDCRLRPDQRAAEQGDLDTAEELKAQLEDGQRNRRKVLEEEGGVHTPRWFVKVDGGDDGEEIWKLRGGKDGYWEERQKGTWTGSRRKFPSTSIESSMSTIHLRAIRKELFRQTPPDTFTMRELDADDKRALKNLTKEHNPIHEKLDDWALWLFDKKGLKKKKIEKERRDKGMERLLKNPQIEEDGRMGGIF
ncbi:hypothetical protein G7Y89_g6908 [Cudoniella acicularis]|uniref:PH domain-containing protein n=1 Tax=Cudoniella acicularis TaxID=354080 RepID=A0A8H4RLT0_9HELO|nr:hypothetical protein G7Y89_g6908 [Cudoniella acicularis]